MIDDEPDPLEVATATFRWVTARGYLSGDAPVFGSPEWLALEDDDPRVTKAITRAALAHWRLGEPLAEMGRRGHPDADVASSHAVSAALDWTAEAWKPTHAQLTKYRTWPCRGYRGQVTVAEARRSWGLPADGGDT